MHALNKFSKSSNKKIIMNNKDQNETREKIYNKEKPKPYYKVGNNPYYINGS